MDPTPPRPAPGRATMREVAALAGVSLKTVSRVVNDERNVSPEVRGRVTAAVRRLDYRPNLAASTLRRTGARTGIVGALLQDLSNAFSSGVLRALEDSARARGTGVLAASLDETPERERALVHDLTTRRVDGLVLMPATERHGYLAAELRAGTPVVFVDRPPRGVDADSVTVDNVVGARTAVEHLADHGHTRIAGLFHLEVLHTARDRLAGYTSAHERRGLGIDHRLVALGLSSVDEAGAAVLRMLDLDEPPTAIFAGRNRLIEGAVRALRARGLSRSVALVGFDDVPMADLLDPGVTVVRQDVARIGAVAADRLFARIDGEDSPPQHVVLDPDLVVRGSGEIRPAG